ncbi:MAG: hypothetical protein K6E54_02650 [Bacteroidaceae bacterium]|nr:hypothetical protein [Bacteroidaceae bacterium]
MKKILLSIAVLLSAMTMNAETLKINGTFGSWGSATYDETTGVVTCPTSNWDGWQFDVPSEQSDGSNYDYLVFELEDVTFEFHIVLKGWNNSLSYQTPNVTAGTTLYAIALDSDELKDKCNEIDQIQMQSHGTGTMTIKSISYMTEDDYQTAKNADDNKEKSIVKYENYTAELAEGTEMGWNSPGWMGDSNLDNLYKTVVVEVASSDGPFQVCVQGWDSEKSEGQAIECHVAKVEAGSPVIIAVPVAEIYKSTIGQIAFQNMNFDHYEYAEDKSTIKYFAKNSISVTKIYFTSNEVASTYTEAPSYPEPDAIESVCAENINTSAAYNLNGQKVNSSFKGIVVKNGKKFLNK